VARTQDYSQTPLLNWAFIGHAKKNQWTWRQLSIDGSIAHISSPLSDFGAAISDAIKHGFRPKEHHWVVTNKTGTTHFHPRSTPLSTPDSPAAKPANGHVPASTKQETQRAG
jgi:hypothetical protein